MAIRYVRIYFRLADKDKQIALSKDLWTFFTFYMDAVMRGRFRRYSGPEVKGINIVNLFLSESGKIEHNINATFRKGWTKLGNTYDFDVDFDYSTLVGTNREKVAILIDTFIKYATLSTVPQMKILVSDLKDAQGKIDLDSVLNKSLDYQRWIQSTQVSQ